MSDCRHCEWTNAFADIQDGSRAMAWDEHMRTDHPSHRRLNLASEEAVTRALFLVGEWTDMLGRINISAIEHSAFTEELAAAIRGIER